MTIKRYDPDKHQGYAHVVVRSPYGGVYAGALNLPATYGTTVLYVCDGQHEALEMRAVLERHREQRELMEWGQQQELDALENRP